MPEADPPDNQPENTLKTRLIRWGPVLLLLSFVVFAADYASGGLMLNLSIQTTPINNSGAGLPPDSPETNFRKGLVLASIWQGVPYIILKGDTLTLITINEDPAVPDIPPPFTQPGDREKRAAEILLATRHTLTPTDLVQVRSLTAKLERYKGYTYSNPHIADGELLVLFETPDARGKPVIEALNAGIRPMSQLCRLLESYRSKPGGTVIPLDAEIVQTIENASPPPDHP